MFLIYRNQRYAYRNRVSLYNNVYNDFFTHRDCLIYKLKVNYVLILFTLDLQTLLNRTLILAIIRHQYTPNFKEKEEVLEFIKVYRLYTREVLVEAVLRVLKELKIKHKLFVITGDNTGNNSTLYQSLYNSLKLEFNDRFSLISRLYIYFHGKLSQIQCLTYIITLIYKDVLSDVKVGSIKEVKRILDSQDIEFKTHDYVLPYKDSRSVVIKVRLLNLQILYSLG